MSSGIAPMSIICAIGRAAMASAADGVAIGAVRKPRIARIESRRGMRDQSLMAVRHRILCSARKDGRVHIFGRSPQHVDRHVSRNLIISLDLFSSGPLSLASSSSPQWRRSRCFASTCFCRSLAQCSNDHEPMVGQTTLYFCPRSLRDCGHEPVHRSGHQHDSEDDDGVTDGRFCR